jgi:CHAD domain-containing protein
MALQLDETESPQTGLRRLAAECIDTALAGLDGADGRDVAIHTVRKQGKQARALLRLVRFGLEGDHRREGRIFREIGRGLSDLRDAAVALEVHGSLLDDVGGSLNPAVCARMRQLLIDDMRSIADRRDRSGSSPSDDDRLRRQLRVARERTQRWRLIGSGEDMLRRGLVQSYRLGRKAAKHAAAGGRAEDFHETRKRAKDFWYALEFLSGRWPDVVLERIGPARHLCELLGDIHDLEIYSAAIDRVASAAEPAGVEILSATAGQRRRRLEAEALRLAHEVFRDNPRDFAVALERSESLKRAAG